MLPYIHPHTPKQLIPSPGFADGKGAYRGTRMMGMWKVLAPHAELGVNLAGNKCSHMPCLSRGAENQPVKGQMLSHSLSPARAFFPRRPLIIK